MRVALVTGGHGFVGTHLRAELRTRGWQVVSVARRAQPARPAPGERFVQLDVSDTGAVSPVLRSVRPDVIFHLAAATAPGANGVTAQVAQTVAATTGLCTAIRGVGLPVRLINAGSSAQYGAVPIPDNPVTEDACGSPVNAYGFAKAAAESVALGLAADGAFEVIPVRAFNHVGPGEPATTVAGAFARRISSILAGRAERMTAADLEAVRDFTDVRDIARGYVELAERGAPGRVYNLCSGRARTVGELLEGLLVAARLDRSVVDEGDLAAVPHARGRIAYQVGSPDRTAKEIGWLAEVDLGRSLRDLLEQVHGALTSNRERL